MFTCREGTEVLAQVLIQIILNNSNLHVHSKFPLLSFKAFASWVSNSILNLQGNKLAGNLTTCTIQHTCCDTCNYYGSMSALGILTYRHYFCTTSPADANQLRDV